MPGSQPESLNSGFQSAESKCANCHSGYDVDAEPSHQWRGSMMAQAARDPLWLACLLVAEQDAIWATGTGNTKPFISCWRQAGSRTTSREYIEFLRDEANGSNTTLSSPTPSGETNPYIAQTDPFFASLKDWGTAIYDLWLNNGGSPPELMAEMVSAPMGQNIEWQPSQMTIQFHSMPSRIYQVQYVDNLNGTDWENLSDPILGDGSTKIVSDTSPMTSGRRFYRVESKKLNNARLPD